MERQDDEWGPGPDYKGLAEKVREAAQKANLAAVIHDKAAKEFGRAQQEARKAGLVTDFRWAGVEITDLKISRKVEY